MHKARRYILPAAALCALLTTGVFTYQAWAASRQSVIAYSDTTPVQEAPPAIVAEPAPTPEPTAPETPPPTPVAKPEAKPQPTPAPKPQPAPQPKPVVPAPEKRVEVPSRKGGSESRAALYYDLNPYVLSVIKTYPTGRYPYLLNTDYANYNGVTENISYQGQLLLKAHPSGNKASHCSGITFEVFFKAMQQRNREVGLSTSDFNGMNREQMKDFMLTWYVANGSKAVSNIAVAVERYGLGKQIHRLEQAKAGDFVDISRENWTGHTVVLINWIWKDGKIIGLKYWSSQGTTNGIDYKTEYFNVPDANGVPYGNVIIDQVYIARVGPITGYTR